MKHAGKEALASVGTLLEALREYPDLVERTPGSFYLRSKAFVHFHEDPAGLFADAGRCGMASWPAAERSVSHLVKPPA